MPHRKRPTKSRYNNPFERIDHQFEDMGKRMDGVDKKLNSLVGALGKHRKEEKDNGKRIEALTRAVEKALGVKVPKPKKKA